MNKLSEAMMNIAAENHHEALNVALASFPGSPYLSVREETPGIFRVFFAENQGPELGSRKWSKTMIIHHRLKILEKQLFPAARPHKSPEGRADRHFLEKT